jgi:hypothetical protein
MCSEPKGHFLFVFTNPGGGIFYLYAYLLVSLADYYYLPLNFP